MGAMSAMGAMGAFLSIHPYSTATEDEIQAKNHLYSALRV